MPDKKEGKRLARAVSFRLTNIDYAAYQKKVEASGLSPSAFFRDCVLKNKTQVIAKTKASEDKQHLIYLFNKASNNLNQLAYKSNSAHLSGKVSDDTYSEILLELQHISRYMKSVLNDVD